MANGDCWRVTARHGDGSVTAVSLDRRGEVRLPGDYVAEHVALAYATTIHKAQGVTVDRSIAVLTQAASAEQVYVAMTRGRHHNQALVICDQPTDDHQPAAPTPAVSAREALSGILGATQGICRRPRRSAGTCTPRTAWPSSSRSPLCQADLRPAGCSPSH